MSRDLEGKKSRIFYLKTITSVYIIPDKITSFFKRSRFVFYKKSSGENDINYRTNSSNNQAERFLPRILKRVCAYF